MVAITAAMPGSTGLLPFGERFPDRLIDVGIAEQHAVTAATGMAMGGLRPVVAIYSTFLTRAFDQCEFDVGPARCCRWSSPSTGPASPATTVPRTTACSTWCCCRRSPGMTVFAPSSYQELQQMLHDALDVTDGPVAIRWPRTAAPVVPENEVGHGLCRPRRVRADDTARVCLVGVGKMLAAATVAAERLAADGIACTVWDPRVVQPLDPALVADAARHDLVVSIEDGLREGGVGSRLADEVAEPPPWRPARLARPTCASSAHPSASSRRATPAAILHDLGLDADGLEAEVRRLVGP